MPVDDYLPQNDSRHDLFEEEDTQVFHFPCGECLHRAEPVEFCQRCRHFVS